MSDFLDALFALVIGLLFLAAVLLFIGLFAGLATVSWVGRTAGTHTGIVTAVETNSLIWDTRRAYFKTSLESTQEDTYCIQNEALYQRLSEASNTGERLTIRFSHPLIEWRWNCGGDHAIIVGIEEALVQGTKP